MTETEKTPINKLRGEINVTLGDQDYVARLSMDAIIKLEERFDSSIIKMATDLSSANIKMGVVIGIITIAIRGGGNDVNERSIKAKLYQIGLVEAYKIAGEILTTCIGGESDSGNEEEAIE